MRNIGINLVVLFVESRKHNHNNKKPDEIRGEKTKSSKENHKTKPKKCSNKEK